MPLVQVRLGRHQLGLGLFLLRGDPVLVALEQFERDRVRVVGAQQLLSLLCQRREPLGQRDAQLPGGGLTLDDLVLELAREALDPFLGQLDPAVQVLDSVLRVIRHQVRLRAAGLVAQGVLLAEAIEVEILTLGERERQTIPALLTVKQSF